MGSLRRSFGIHDPKKHHAATAIPARTHKASSSNTAVQHGPTRTFLPASRQQTLQIPRGKTSSSLPRQTQKLHHSGIRLLGLSRDSLHKSTKYNPLLLVRDPQGRRTSSVSPATPRDRRVRYRYGRLPTGGVWLRQRLVVACLLAFYYSFTLAI